MRSWSPRRIAPSNTRTVATTPRYSSKYESRMSALSGAAASPVGGEMRKTMDSSRSWMPSPVLPETHTASSAGMASSSSISARTRSGSAEGRSILLMAGTMSRFAFMARFALETVCASTPWVASTTSTAPSQAASERGDLVGEVDVAGVSMRLNW